jgi:hypothetical protein
MSDSLTEIRVNIKVVKNLGNYNMLHMEAGVSTPKRADETFEEGFERVYNAVETAISDKLAEAVAELKKVV